MKKIPKTITKIPELDATFITLHESQFYALLHDAFYSGVKEGEKRERMGSKTGFWTNSCYSGVEDWYKKSGLVDMFIGTRSL